MDMMKMMQQAKQMQDKMAVMQNEMADKQVIGQSGGGMVKVTMTCKGAMISIDIAPEVIDPTDPEMLSDLIVAATNDAKLKGDTQVEQKTKEVMGGMGLPEDIKLPF